MKHYYIIRKTETGLDLSTKRNFKYYGEAKEYFDKVKYNDSGCRLMFVDASGKEKLIEHMSWN